MFLLSLIAGCALISRADLADRMDEDQDGIPRPKDCDDADASVGAAVARYRDADEDGYGAGEPVPICESLAGYVSNASDCNDTDPLVLDVTDCIPETCGTGVWGDIEVDAATLHVDGAALNPGDGSINAPFRTVQEAVDEAAERGGGKVALAAGRYVENVDMADRHDGVSIFGRCKELVTLDGSAGDQLPTLKVAGNNTEPSVSLQGVTITGGTRRGIYVKDAALLVAECTLTANTSAGLLADGNANVTLEAVGVSGTSSGAGGKDGFGVAVEGGATLSATGCTLLANAAIGVYAHGSGTVAILVDTTVTDTRPAPEGTGAAGMVATQGASLTASGCTLSGNAEVGVAAYDDGTYLELDDSSVVDTLAAENGTFGYGLLASDGAQLVASQSSVHRSVNAGVAALGDGTLLTLDGVLILDTQPAPDGTMGYGLAAAQGAVVTANLSTVYNNTAVGVLASGERTVVNLHDTQVLNTVRGRNTSLAVGVAAQDGAEVVGTNIDSSDNEGPGVYVSAGAVVTCSSCDFSRDAFAGALVSDGTLSLVSSTILDTGPGAELGGGFGVYAAAGSGHNTLSLLDSTIGPHPYAAVWLDGNGRYDVQGNDLSGSDGVVQGVAVLHGNAVFAQRGVTASDGDNGLLLLQNSYSGASIIAVLLDASSATLSQSTWSGNGTDVWQQHCDDTTALTADDVADVPTADICPSRNILTAYDISFGGLHLPEVDAPQ
ncbi:MAG: hypothetical protein EXR69_06215 [Myxococcales bacterium]|nr:hypothetical protein [Myxococcales bacterium]